MQLQRRTRRKLTTTLRRLDKMIPQNWIFGLGMLLAFSLISKVQGFFLSRPASFVSSTSSREQRHASTSRYISASSCSSSRTSLRLGTTPSSFGRRQPNHQEEQKNLYRHHAPRGSKNNFNFRQHSKKSTPASRQRRQRQRARKEWLLQATQRILVSPTGSLGQGKWHEITSLFHGWATLAKYDRQAPLRMEALLKRLLLEQAAQDRVDLVDIALYNTLLDAWACAALFRTHPGPTASQRAREILVTLQETHEQQQQQPNQSPSTQSLLQPNEKSFDIVLHVVTRIEGPLVARRILAWKEHLYKTGKNIHAKPLKGDYVMVLDAYANSRNENAGILAEGLLAHMKATGVVELDAHCYNIAIKAWTKSKRGGRQAAEHADRILEEMQVEPNVEPDIFTYGTVISAWANSGMRGHGISRVEELLRTVEEHPVLEPETVILNSVLSAWVKAKIPASVNRTHEILQHMQECEQADIISYNTHLHALALHGNQRGNAQRAQDMLEFLEAQPDPEFQPNLFSYNCALASCAKSKEQDAAVRAVGIFQRLLKRTDVKPDSFAFNQLLLALSRSSLTEAAEMTKKWLNYMEKCHESGLFPKARPDSVSYLAVISAYSRSGIRGAASEADKVFQELQQKHANGRKELKPNKYLYNAMIDCWAKSKEGTFGARKAEALLQEMQKQYEAGDVTMQPDLVSYNGVLNAWALSNTRCCARQAEIYLERMWDLHQQGNRKVKPDDRSYNTVINAISKSKHRRKAQRALRVLRMMDMLYRSGQIEVRPSEITYTAVLNSCAFPVARDPRSRRKALDTALFTLAEVQSSEYCRPNEATYGTFIRACANLLHDDDKLRRDIIEKAFIQCRRDGQVGDLVLSFLRRAAPADLYDELLADFISSGTILTSEDLPQEWRCNVNEGGLTRSYARAISNVSGRAKEKDSSKLRA